jgi:sigma-54 dependent transcriptional regulator, acetoin dehydrogenase operon transcriptional activator AcoR
VDSLPAWAAGRLARSFTAVRRDRPAAQPFVLTARSFDQIGEQLAGLVDTVVEVAPLRFRPEDVLSLARHFAWQERHREVTFTARAARALTTYDWPGNVAQLRRVVRDAAARADVIDAQHLAAEIFGGGTHTLTRLETLERDEIVRCVNQPGVTMVQAAESLGVSRATLYRKIAQYDIRVPGR